MNSKKTLAIICSVILSAWTSHGAIELAKWTFETSLPTLSGSHVAEGGVNAAVSFASGFHSSPTAATYNNPQGNGSTESFSANRWTAGDYWQFTTSSLGYQNIQLDWDQGSSSTGPDSFILEWSANGGSYIIAGGSYTVLDVFSGTVSTNPNLWRSSTTLSTTHYSVNLSAISALNSATTVAFRLVNQTSGLVAGGTSRVDNFTISGDVISTAAVPEPSTYVAALMLAIPFGVHGVRYWRNRKQV